MTARSIRWRTRDEGVATVWMLVICGVLVVTTAAGLMLARLVAVRQHLDSAADSAAIAAASRLDPLAEGCAAAATIAHAYAVRLDACTVEPDGRTVRVEVSRSPPPLLDRALPRVVGRARAGPG